MQSIIERCAGLDVHQASVVACVLIGVAGRPARRETRAFQTMTRDLEALHDWLKAAGVTHVGMESLRADCGQRSPHPECARPQDGREGR